MEGAHDEPETQNDPKDEDSEELEELEAEKDCEALLVFQNSTPTVEKRWLRKNYFSFHRYNTWAKMYSCDCWWKL